MDVPIKGYEAVDKLIAKSLADGKFNYQLVGICCGKDKDKSDYVINKLTPEANSGNKYAQYTLGYIYQHMGNKLYGIEWYKMAADQNYAEAQVDLGFIYMYILAGDFQENYRHAFRLFKLAADQGNARAQCRLGYMYQYSIGTEHNLEISIKYYKMSADQGDTDAKFYLQCIDKSLLKKIICVLLYRTSQNKKIMIDKNKLAEHLRLFPGKDYIKAMRDFYMITQNSKK